MYKPGLNFDGISTIVPGQWYACVGRTIYTCSGVCNGVMACCNWSNADDGDGSVTRYNMNGHSVTDTRSKTTLEYTILNRRISGQFNDFTQNSFGLRDDSGSLLINRYGQVCALYYGNAMSWVGLRALGNMKTNAGLAMSMTDLIKGIETRLGGDVSLCISEDDLNLHLRRGLNA